MSKTRTNFPGRIESRRKSALGRRLADVETHAKDASVDSEAGALAKLKLERAKSDVSGLKAKLGVK
jgi:hypothetical protein